MLGLLLKRQTAQVLRLAAGPNGLSICRNAGDTGSFWYAMGSASTNNRWNGVRRLEKGELQRLAEEIVRQVKLRGPFLSMADFLNRRLGNASELTRMGALQAAIDLSGINNSVEIGVNVEGYINGPYAHVNHVNPDMLKEADESFRDLSVGVPGYLLQQDLG